MPVHYCPGKCSAGARITGHSLCTVAHFAIRFSLMAYKPEDSQAEHADAAPLQCWPATDQVIGHAHAACPVPSWPCPVIQLQISVQGSDDTPRPAAAGAWPAWHSHAPLGRSRGEWPAPARPAPAAAGSVLAHPAAAASRTGRSGPACHISKKEVPGFHGTQDVLLMENTEGAQQLCTMPVGRSEHDWHAGQACRAARAPPGPGRLLLIAGFTATLHHACYRVLHSICLTRNTPGIHATPLHNGCIMPNHAVQPASQHTWLEWAMRRVRWSGKLWYSTCMICTAVSVLPVPGGPTTMVRPGLTPDLMAST